MERSCSGSASLGMARSSCRSGLGTKPKQPRCQRTPKGVKGGLWSICCRTGGPNDPGTWSLGQRQTRGCRTLPSGQWSHLCRLQVRLKFCSSICFRRWKQVSLICCLWGSLVQYPRILMIPPTVCAWKSPNYALHSFQMWSGLVMHSASLTGNLTGTIPSQVYMSALTQRTVFIKCPWSIWWASIWILMESGSCRAP